VTSPTTVRIELHPCPALEEADACSWFGELDAAPHPALEGIAWAVSPRARVGGVEPSGDAVFAWEIVVDEAAAPREVPEERLLANLSKGAAFRFERRRPLRG